MLFPLPRPDLLRRNEPGGEGIELAMRLLEVLVNKPDACNERRDMRACGLRCSGSDPQRRLARHVQNVRRFPTPDSMALQDFGDCRLSGAGCFVGRRHGFPQVEQPFHPEIVFKFEHRWKIAPELLPQAICEAVALPAKIFGDARPFAQFDDDGVGNHKQPKATRIDTQRGCHHLGVATVILGARQCEAVAEAIHLLQVNGVNFEAALDQRLDHGAVRDLDCDMNLAGLDNAARCYQPGRHLGKPFARLLGGEEDLGITVALVPASAPGVKIGRRHLPASQAFQNGPNEGRDVSAPLDWVVGGRAQIGAGWTMTMSALAPGRGISLPSLAGAATAFSARSTGAYARIREQFGIPIGDLEGVQDRLGHLAVTSTESTRRDD